MRMCKAQQNGQHKAANMSKHKFENKYKRGQTRIAVNHNLVQMNLGSYLSSYSKGVSTAE
jgi:hypothetical protein